jgi:hypothetical protein
MFEFLRSSTEWSGIDHFESLEVYRPVLEQAALGHELPVSV